MIQFILWKGTRFWSAGHWAASASSCRGRGEAGCRNTRVNKQGFDKASVFKMSWTSLTVEDTAFALLWYSKWCGSLQSSHSPPFIRVVTSRLYFAHRHTHLSQTGCRRRALAWQNSGRPRQATPIMWYWLLSIVCCKLDIDQTDVPLICIHWFWGDAAVRTGTWCSWCIGGLQENTIIWSRVLYLLFSLVVAFSIGIVAPFVKVKHPCWCNLP